MSKIYEELAPEIAEAVYAVFEDGQIAHMEDELDAAEGFYLQAWDLLPEPKLYWDYFSNVLPWDITELYRDKKDFEKALQWLETVRESYGPGRDASVEFLAATIWFEMGETQKAYEEFSRQYQTSMERPFQEEDPKYFEFYKNYKQG